jgi:hypothetical protein
VRNRAQHFKQLAAHPRDAVRELAFGSADISSIGELDAVLNPDVAGLERVC